MAWKAGDHAVIAYCTYPDETRVFGVGTEVVLLGDPNTMRTVLVGRRNDQSIFKTVPVNDLDRD